MKHLVESKLVDQVCVELIEHRRERKTFDLMGRIEREPVLRKPDHLLDVIDADICVSAELGLPSPATQYQHQFPELATEIEELATLHDPIGDRPIPGLAKGTETKRSTRYLPTELGNLPKRSMKVPSWFEPEAAVVQGPPAWVLRGRRRDDDTPLALRVLQRPDESSIHSSSLLDLCETAAQHDQPGWIRPWVATVQHSYVGTIRPWFYGESLEQRVTRGLRISQPAAALLQRLAQLAFSVASAHHAGATHGGIHARNVVIDHQERWYLVDPIINQSAVSRFFPNHSPSRINSVLDFQQRSQIDVHDLIELIRLVLSSYQSSLVSASTLKGLMDRWKTADCQAEFIAEDLMNLGCF